MSQPQNANPTVYATSSTVTPSHTLICDTESFVCALKNERQDLIDDVSDEDEVDKFDSFEVFQILRHLNDPEHPLTLEQLKVITVR